MADVRSEQSTTEVLPDGTVHQKMSFTNNQSTVDRMDEVIETFERPPHYVQETETIEEVQADGTIIKRQVAFGRMIHSYETRRESFDENNHTSMQLETYNIEEVVPNTMSAFDAGLDSDYEEEVRTKREKGYSHEKDTEEVEETLPDGTKRIKKIRMNRVVHIRKGPQDRQDPRSSHQVSEDYPCEEVVPMTQSAFVAGQDSDHD